jgi:hypothetical protein
VLQHIGLKLKALTNAQCKDVCEFAIEAITKRGDMFQKEDGIFKRERAMVAEAQNDLDTAVRFMSLIQYENTDNSIPEKVEDYLCLAEWWFDKDESTQAEIYVNKASHLIYDSRIDLESQLRYKRAFVQVSDSKRDYTNASQGYYNLS